MLFYLQLILLLTASIVILILDRVRQKTNLIYIVTLVTVVVVFGLTFLFRLMLPSTHIFADWQNFVDQATISLVVNNENWLLGIFWQSLLLFYVASYPSRKDYMPVKKSLGVFFFSIIGLIVVFSANLFTYIFVWTFMLFVFLTLKLIEKEKTFSWTFIILFLVWGVLFLGLMSRIMGSYEWKNLGTIPIFFELVLLGLSTILVKIEFFKDKNLSFFTVLLKILLMFTLNIALLNFEVTGIPRQMQVLFEILFLFIFLFKTIKIVFISEFSNLIEQSFFLLQLLVLFLVVSGVSKIGYVTLVIWIGYIAVLAINKIEDRAFIFLRRLYLLFGISFPFLLSTLSPFFMSSIFTSILFCLLNVLMFISMLRVGYGKPKAFYTENSWLNVSIEDHDWYRVDDWAKILHWFGAIFVWGVIWLSLIWINPESLLDTGYTFPWQLIFVFVILLGIFGIWRFRRNLLKGIERVNSIEFPLKSFSINLSFLSNLRRFAEIPEEILESSSGVFWTFLFILFILSLVL
jgi:hypothetical protein